jgi:FixJ family two-component response regulator
VNTARSVVAVVDDDERMLESLGNLLESAGHNVRLYSAATMLYEHGDLSEIDCLISDIGMPDMDGFELQQWAHAERPELPVILITGRPEMRARYAALIRSDRYFEKPFDGQQLLASVRAAIAAGRLQGNSEA